MRISHTAGFRLPPRGCFHTNSDKWIPPVVSCCWTLGIYFRCFPFSRWAFYPSTTSSCRIRWVSISQRLWRLPDPGFRLSGFPSSASGFRLPAPRNRPSSRPCLACRLSPLLKVTSLDRIYDESCRPPPLALRRSTLSQQEVHLMGYELFSTNLLLQT